MFDSIRSVTSSAVGALEYIAEQKGQAFSIRRWVAEDRPGVLFMPYKAGQIAGLRSAISGWMRLAIFETMDGPSEATAHAIGRERRLWFVVDELDALGQIDGLKDALAACESSAAAASWAFNRSPRSPAPTATVMRTPWSRIAATH